MTNIPWIEKYRPQTVDELLGSDSLRELIRGFIRKRDIPHLLFSGPPSTGKTTTALILGRAFYGDSLAGNFLELNASDERGIDTIREKVKEFAKTIPNNDVGFKIVFLDEADALTTDAQQALRRMMEVYSQHTRFILSCNYINRIIPPIQSRVAIIKFSPIPTDQIHRLVDKIVEREQIDIDDRAKEELIEIARDDLRKIITILQSAHYASNGRKIDTKTIESISGKVSTDRAKEIITLIIQGKRDEARDRTISMLDEGNDPEEIIQAILRAIDSSNLPSLDESRKIEMIRKISEYHYRITQGANPYIQLIAMIIDIGS
ncbi:MAG: replication factor C small subunit [Candidatus Micrarchaeota archaeon]|nr:replication factor C small subunit [Candidatus Micrarchaeota archaeon]MCX8154238.1 replication factor C small subunit [Candidatus Micrarchaeota archaeon]